MIGGKFFVETKPYQYAKCWTGSQSATGIPCASAYNNYVAFTIGQSIEFGSYTSQAYTKTGTSTNPFSLSVDGFSDIHAGAGNVAAITSASNFFTIYNYSGTLVTARKLTFDSDPYEIADLRKVVRDSSNNIYLAFEGIDGVYGSVGGVAKFNSSYVFQWAATTRETLFGSYEVDTLALDSSGNMFTVGRVRTNTPELRIYDTSGTRLYRYSVNKSIYARSYACSDGTDFYFAWTTTDDVGHVGKFTSGGSVSWIKSYAISGVTADIRGLTYSAADNTIVVTADFNSATERRGAFKITTAGTPVSGSALVMNIKGAGSADHTGYAGYGTNGALFIPFTSSGGTDYQGVLSTTLSVPYAPVQSNTYQFKNLAGTDISNVYMTAVTIAGTASSSAIGYSSASVSLADVTITMSLNTTSTVNYPYTAKESQLLVF